MTLDALGAFFLWCTVINYGVLLLWLIGFLFFRPQIRWLHCRLFNISDEAFDLLNYGGIGLYKLGIILFNLVPYIALRIIGP